VATTDRPGSGTAPRTVVSPPRVVGRDRELHELHSVSKNLSAGRGQSVLIEGEAGIGKTRLVDEFTRSAGTAVWGRCWDSGGAPPYWPWIQVVRRLAQLRTDEELAEDVIVGTVELVGLVPELARRLPALAPLPQDDDPETRRFRLCDAVASFLWAAAERSPLVVVLDDLHDADESSLILLHLVARELRSHAVLVVGTYRGDDSRARLQAHRWLTQVGRESQVLLPQPFTSSDIAELITDRFVVDQPADLAASVHAATRGNPLFVTEMLRLIDERGPGVDVADLGVPDSLRHVLRLRVERVGPTAHQALSGAAVLGALFEQELLAAVTSIAELEIVTALDETVQARLVEAVGDRPGRYRFSHPLLRATIYDDLAIDVRQHLHAQAAAALAQRHADDPRRAAEIAHHLQQAGPHASPAAAVTWLRRTAEHASSQHAHAEAVAAYEQALDIAAAEPPSAADRAPLLCDLAAALFAAGNGEAALERFAQARHLADATTDIATLTRATIGWSEAHRHEGGDLATRVRMLTGTVAKARGHEPRSEVELLLQLGVDYLGALRTGTTVADGDPYELAVATNADAVTAAAGQRVTVEITEHAIVQDYPRLKTAIRRLRELGVRMAVDDVGAGFSGLRHIISLSPDILKLDGALVAGVDRSEEQQAMILALLTYATRTNTIVVAERVETAGECDTLRRLGIHHAQGFYFGRPTSLEEVLATADVSA
jgi:tetratricopeptide (TPR) repeat protein